MEKIDKSPGFSPAKRILSFKFAFKGLKYVVLSQPNVWIQLVIAIAVVIAGFVFSVTHTEWVVLALAIGVVLAAEAFNTAIELLVDKISPQYDPVAGKVKDIAAGAVLISAASAVAAGLIIFLPKIMG